MSRPREFDADRALHQSMEVFWEKGYKSTSFEDLTRTTQVKKQSLYCVFGDKRSLFLKALALYRKQSLSMLEEMVARDASPLETLEAIIHNFVYYDDETLCRGCLMVNSALEFGTGDEEVMREVEMMFADAERLIEQVIQKGQQQQLITNRRTSKELAAHLTNALNGARIMEKAGIPREQIEAVLRTSCALIAP